MPSRVQAISHRKRRWRPQRSPQNHCASEAALCFFPQTASSVSDCSLTSCSQLIARHPRFAPDPDTRLQPPSANLADRENQTQIRLVPAAARQHEPKGQKLSSKCSYVRTGGYQEQFQIRSASQREQKTHFLAPKALKRKQPDEPLGNPELPTSTIQKLTASSLSGHRKQNEKNKSPQHFFQRFRPRGLIYLSVPCRVRNRCATRPGPVEAVASILEGVAVRNIPQRGAPLPR